MKVYMVIILGKNQSWLSSHWIIQLTMLLLWIAQSLPQLLPKWVTCPTQVSLSKCLVAGIGAEKPKDWRYFVKSYVQFFFSFLLIYFNLSCKSKKILNFCSQHLDSQVQELCGQCSRIRSVVSILYIHVAGKYNVEVCASSWPVCDTICCDLFRLLLFSFMIWVQIGISSVMLSTALWNSR